MKAEDILKRHDDLASRRTNWESHWLEIGQHLVPRYQDFNQTLTPGQKRTEYIFDSAGPVAVERYAALIEAMISPRTQKWHRIRASNDELNDDDSVKAYFDDVTNRMFKVRYGPRANFASQMHEAYVSVAAFGTGILEIEKSDQSGIRYRARSLGECYIDENSGGIVDTLHRKFTLTSRQAAQKFGDKLPAKIAAAVEKEPFREWMFLHCVKPNNEYAPGAFGPRGFAYSSYYVSIDEKSVVEEGGYRTFPYAVFRLVTAPGEIYGRSPAMLALPDVKTLNQMVKTNMRVAHREAEPPILLMDDGILEALNTTPNAMNFGMMTPEGKPKAVPFQSGAKLPYGLDMEDRRRQMILSTFNLDMLQTLRDNPNMTATMAMELVNQRAILFGPEGARLQSEGHGPMVEREYQILDDARMLPDMPDELAQAGAGYEIAYDSPLARAQRAEEAIALTRTLEIIGPLASVDPKILQRFNGDEAVKMVAEITGLPSRILRSDDEYEALTQQSDAMSMVGAAAQAGPGLAQTVKLLTDQRQAA